MWTLKTYFVFVLCISILYFMIRFDQQVAFASFILIGAKEVDMVQCRDAKSNLNSTDAKSDLHKLSPNLPFLKEPLLG